MDWRTIKRAVAVVVVALVSLVAVVLIRTAAFTSKQLPPAPATPLKLDEAKAVDHLQRAVRIKTVSHQEPVAGSGEAFLQLHALLQEAYPKVHATMKRELVGGASLLYTWPGEDTGAKPILLLAHMDVVPGETGSPWEHAPFSGELADGHVWGRGTLDDKGNLIGILEAAESLLAEGFKPKRTVYFAFGHDEEIGGKGAMQIAALLKSRGVRAEICLDEGMCILEGVVPGLTKPVATIGIAEKGYLTLELVVEGQGGHSSQPPKETVLGILSKAIARLEADPMPAQLKGPARQMLEVLGPEMPFSARIALANLWLFEGLVTRRLEAGKATSASLRTTLAVTIMSGGDKENVLPSRARAVVNSRLMPGASVEGVLDHVRRSIGDDRVSVKPLGTPHLASPVADVHARGYAMLNSTIRQVFPEVLVAPGLVLGATDSRHYAEVSDGTYKFSPLWLNQEALSRIHGPNERISTDNYLRLIRFYGQLIRNAR